MRDTSFPFSRSGQEREGTPAWKKIRDFVKRSGEKVTVKGNLLFNVDVKRRFRLKKRVEPEGMLEKRKKKNREKGQPQEEGGTSLVFS